MFKCTNNTNLTRWRSRMSLKCWLPIVHNLVIESHVPFQLSSSTTKLCLSGTCSRLYLHKVFWKLYVFTKYFMWGRSCWQSKSSFLTKLEHLRSEDTPAAPWLHTLLSHIGIPSQKNNRSRTENFTERTRFSKSRSKDLEDTGQGQRSSHATHLMLVIICTKYAKNPSRTVDATRRTWFSRPWPNDLEDIGQGQRSLYATHPLILVIICAKYGKNPSRTVDFIFKVKAEKFQKIAKNSNFQILKKK